MSYGYNFYFSDDGDVLTFPITPGELKITIGSNNKVVTLINEGDINILKSPTLAEVEFEARFPMRKYPYSRTPYSFQAYFDKFKELKENKKPFRFIVTRTTPGGKRLWDTNLLMALEKMELSESADEGDDVLIYFKLRQYKEYGVKTIQIKEKSSNTTSTANNNRTSKSETSNKNKNQSYTVKSGDCLLNISKKFYGTGSLWKNIYDANKSAIEQDAKKHGKKSSSNGHWIFAGLNLTVPPK